MILIVLLFGCGNETEGSACTDWLYEPVGLTATAICECDSSEILFYCDPDTCSGSTGATTCEPNWVVTQIHEACPNCRISFTEASAISWRCP